MTQIVDLIQRLSGARSRFGLPGFTHASGEEHSQFVFDILGDTRDFLILQSRHEQNPMVRGKRGDFVMFQCERDGGIKSFPTYSECQRFVRREGDYSRLWSYIGAAQLAYQASFK